MFALLGSAPLFFCLSAVSCGGDPPPPQPVASAAPAAPAPIPSAVDRVEPGEIAEGSERAFGFPIPRAMRVESRFPDTVRAAGHLPLDALANYVRARVVADRVETGPAKTVFSRATLKSSPAHMLRVEVIAYAGGGSALVVRDVTRPPATTDVKPTDPWNAPGFDPKDRRADPKRFE
ncbi:MAG: hypothetical protein R3B70_45255 [Polyangiaceae bacterium]